MRLGDSVKLVSIEQVRSPKPPQGLRGTWALARCCPPAPHPLTRLCLARSSPHTPTHPYPPRAPYLGPRPRPTPHASFRAQTREGLTDANSVFEEVTGGTDEIELGSATVASRAYVSWFGFKGGDQQKKVVNLSGGERNRVQLAKLLRVGGNLLLMDEPTNDLDGEGTPRPPSPLSRSAVSFQSSRLCV